MTTPLSAPEVEAFATMSKVRYGQIVIAVLEKRLSELDAVCRTAPVATVQVAQGRAQELADLLDKFKRVAQP